MVYYAPSWIYVLILLIVLTLHLYTFNLKWREINCMKRDRMDMGNTAAGCVYLCSSARKAAAGSASRQSAGAAGASASGGSPALSPSAHHSPAPLHSPQSPTTVTYTSGQVSYKISSMTMVFVVCFGFWSPSISMFKYYDVHQLIKYWVTVLFAKRLVMRPKRKYNAHSVQIGIILIAWWNTGGPKSTSSHIIFLINFKYNFKRLTIWVGMMLVIVL